MLAHLRNQHNREDGFTLIELLIVVLIIGILAAIAIPVYLGLQNQAKNNTAKQDTNSTVHKIQVALTEGQTITAALGDNTDATGTYRSDGTNVTSTIASDGKNYTVVGTQKDTQFTYTYDSTTGKFTEGTADVVLGGGSTQTITSSFETSETATNDLWKEDTSYSELSNTAGTSENAYMVTNYARTGTRSLSLPDSPSGRRFPTFHPGTLLKTDTTYTVTLYVYFTSTSIGYFNVDSNNFALTGSKNITPTSAMLNKWNPVTFSVKTTTNAASDPYIRFYDGVRQTGTNIYVDDVTFTPAP